MRAGSSPPPPPPSSVASAATLIQIEFAEALRIVGAHAVTDAGRERVQARRPTDDPAVVEEDLATAGEVLRLLEDGDPFRPVRLPDLREPLATLTVVGSVLDGKALVAIGEGLEAMAELGTTLERVADDAPRVAGFRVDLPPRDVARRFVGSFDPDGSLRDEASPELKKARKSARAARERLVRFLERVLQEVPGREKGDGNVTLRNGRYVIPVRRDAKAAARGIVHAESSSGATIFVEPADAVAMGNELHAAEAAEKRAELAVLRELTMLARSHSEQIAAGWAMAVAVDDVYARARYALESKSVRPQTVPAPSPICIVDGRHPLLLAELDEVVAFSLQTEQSAGVILISGPNTGGKTVLLKGVGLFCALTQSGVIPPVGDGSVLPVFETILCDIGDRQSIADNLSTYGAHLTAARDAIGAVTDRSLILIDELGTGTDPAEGAALGAAILSAFLDAGALTIATTHLGQLKEFAAETPGVLNASLHFDPERLAPTYRFNLGVPGRSYGLALAQRLGLPDHVLAEAERRRPEAERSIEALLADLESREHELQDREAAMASLEERLVAERDGLEQLRRQLEEQDHSLREARKDLEVEGRQEARRYLLEARKRVEEALGVARAAVSEATAREARKLVEEGVREEASALKKLEDQAARQGWTVKVGRARSRPASTPSKATPSPRMRREAASGPETEARTEIDLRGMTGDDAELEMQRALDAAVVEGLSSLRIIHGKGTGALRERVRSLLKRDKRVARFDTAPSFEGGWGVTIAELRS